jgi:tetrahydromethanopterin S-methyltransferase subunit B
MKKQKRPKPMEAGKMSEEWYKVVEVKDKLNQSETGSFWHVIDPLGNVVYGAQYQYMAHRTANDLNATCKPMIARIAALEAALGDLEQSLTGMTGAMQSGVYRNTGVSRDIENLLARVQTALKKADGNE